MAVRELLRMERNFSKFGQCGGTETVGLWDYVENGRSFSAVIEQNLEW